MIHIIDLIGQAKRFVLGFLFYYDVCGNQLIQSCSESIRIKSDLFLHFAKADIAHGYDGKAHEHVVTRRKHGQKLFCEVKYTYYRVNFPNGDMVGHTGSLAATRCSMEALDLQLARILKVVDELGGVALITADHGNADEMYEMDKKTKQPKADKNGNFKAKTSHTLNPVPCIIYDNTDAKNFYSVKADNGNFGLSNVAATMVNLMGYKAPEMWNESIIDVE